MTRPDSEPLTFLRFREIYAMRAEGMTLVEIRDLTGMNTGTLKNLLHGVGAMKFREALTFYEPELTASVNAFNVALARKTRTKNAPPTADPAPTTPATEEGDAHA